MIKLKGLGLNDA